MHIKQGDFVGLVGHTGDSDGDHLHIEIFVIGEDKNNIESYLNPLDYFEV